jgi:hypothetical protein
MVIPDYDASVPNTKYEIHPHDSHPNPFTYASSRNMLPRTFFTQTDTARTAAGFSRWSRWHGASPQQMLGMAALLREKRSTGRFTYRPLIGAGIVLRVCTLIVPAQAAWQAR